ncbi:MAG TPA: malto-oligosyltrehalose synthase, partial [Candidatus Goldiibacteriota bacterium]|nr:malto-oligosyltrehalose synthase [Candidatus Goldiibacteriota bacterium]
MTKIPSATYRLQFGRKFTFKDACRIMPYLAALGITDIYASPVFKCRKGSTHGYDVTDMSEINPELGGLEGFNEALLAAQKAGLGWIQDIVPNHMAYSSENPRIYDLLENGMESEYRDFFDINWDHQYGGIKGKLLAPFLGTPYGEALENGEICLIYDERGFLVKYYEQEYPLKMESYQEILSQGLESIEAKMGADAPDYIKLKGIISSCRPMPQGSGTKERKDRAAFVKKLLWELYSTCAEVRGLINRNLEKLNGNKGSPESYNGLDSILSAQNYRLAYWKVGSDEINYRRFFNINELISVRQENEGVFEATHSLVLKLAAEKKITGFRIDHIDGLFDPTGYLRKIREKEPSIFIVAEKILSFSENLPHFWPIQGSTGYDFLNYSDGIFCFRQNAKKFDRIYEKFAGLRHGYRDEMLAKKRLIIGKRMAGDVENLASCLKEVSYRDRHGSDMTMYALKRALVEILALFPVYRTYVEPNIFTEQDRECVKYTLQEAARSMPGLAKEIEFIGKFLLLKFPPYMDEEAKLKWTGFIMKFQQLTGPLMAKGFEDTFFYVYNRLVSLNEVGGFPERFGVSEDEFHEYCRKKAASWPGSMNATSTHDTKRGEDTRARINVISEFPEEWERRIRKWRKLNSKISAGIDGNDEYFYYQTLAGTMPQDEAGARDYRQRIKDYIIKAVREAKVHTEWIKPDEKYESSFMSFVDRTLDEKGLNVFLDDIKAFSAMLAHYGAFNSLGRLIIKASAPGIPDFYQGSELWDLSLVDPDNRRSVDFEGRFELLREIAE